MIDKVAAFQISQPLMDAVDRPELALDIGGQGCVREIVAAAMRRLRKLRQLRFDLLVQFDRQA